MPDSILQFKTTPKGFFYGGKEHFQEEIIKTTLEEYTKISLEVADKPEFDEFIPLLPITLHVLLDDNTGLKASLFPTSRDHRDAIAEAMRSFLYEAEANFNKSDLHKGRKVAAVCIIMEMWYSKFDTTNMSEEEIAEKARNRWKDIDVEKISALLFNFQHPDKTKDELLIYRIISPGHIEPYDDIKVKDTILNEGAWADMLTRKPDRERSSIALTPKEAEQFVSRTIKSVIQASTVTEPLTEEEKQKVNAHTPNPDDIDISDLFRRGTSDTDTDADSSSNPGQ